MNKVKAKPEEKLEQQKPEQHNQSVRRILQLQANNLDLIEKIQDLKTQFRSLSNKVLLHSASTLASQRQKVEYELISINKSTEIKRKELKKIKREGTLQQKLQVIQDSGYQIRIKSKELEKIRKQVKELQHLNKNLELKTRNINRQTKSLSKINVMRQALSVNRYLKSKMTVITEREKVTKKRIKTQINDSSLTKSRLNTLPQINDSRKSLKVKKQNQIVLQKQKGIIARWIGDHRMLVNQKLDTQLNLMQKQHDKLSQKISFKETEIMELRKQIQRLKFSHPENQIYERKKSFQTESKLLAKTKHWGGGFSERVREMRKDWVGKFDSLRFSDARFIRQQCRLYSILHNDEGYYKFSYFSLKSGEIFETSPPFNHLVAPSGQERVFEVVWPDYIKSIQVIIDTSISRIAGLNVRSFSGIEGEFKDSVYQGKPFNKKGSKNQFQTYVMQIGNNQTPMCLFGSYHVHYDSNNKLTDVFLQGLGVDIIQELHTPK